MGTLFDAQNAPNARYLLDLLIKLYADQNGVTITYNLETEAKQ